jgi:hypothetical protein
MLLLVLSCAASCGGGQKKPTTHALCEGTLPVGHGQPRASDWVQVLLKTDRRGDGLYASRICTGELIEHRALPAACEVQTPDPGVTDATPLTEASVIERILPEGRRLVWIMTHRFPNGDGFGPVAAATIEQGQIRVGSVGLLRLRPMRVDLELWAIGQKAVLMAAGESCKDPQRASTCRRAANLLVFDQGRFHSAPIRRSDTHECIDAPWVEFLREADLTLENGWNRHMKIVTNINHDQRYVVVSEQVDVADTDPAHTDVPARDVRRIDTERFIHVDGPYFYTRQSPLWPRIIPTQGKTHMLSNDRSGF